MSYIRISGIPPKCRRVVVLELFKHIKGEIISVDIEEDASVVNVRTKAAANEAQNICHSMSFPEH